MTDNPQLREITDGIKAAIAQAKLIPISTDHEPSVKAVYMLEYVSQKLPALLQHIAALQAEIADLHVQLTKVRAERDWSETRRELAVELIETMVLSIRNGKFDAAKVEELLAQSRSLPAAPEKK